MFVNTVYHLVEVEQSSKSYSVVWKMRLAIIKWDLPAAHSHIMTCISPFEMCKMVFSFFR